MEVTTLPVEDLKPADNNPRQITPAAVDAVADSIDRYGWRQPIVVDANKTVIAGHVRLQAAQKLGHKTVPVHIAEDLTEQQVDLLRLVDNKSAEESTWDFDLLSKELLRLSNDGALEAVESAWTEEEIQSLFQDDDELPTGEGAENKPVDVWGDGFEGRPNVVMLSFEVPADRVGEYRDAINLCIAGLEGE